MLQCKIESKFELNIEFHKVFIFVGCAIEKDKDKDVWIMYKEALEDLSIFRSCWNKTIEDLRAAAPRPTSSIRGAFERFASIITGLWAMVEFAGLQSKYLGN